jgi:hypothetical protein
MLRRGGIVYPSPDPKDVVLVLPRNLADVLQVWKGQAATEAMIGPRKFGDHHNVASSGAKYTV